MDIIFATKNKGKFAEVSAMLKPLNLTLHHPDEFQLGDVAETGLTFVENALIKARHAAKISGLPAIADDSGLVVPYLKGAPGIYSSRYAGTHGNDDANIKKLLEELSFAKGCDRRAYFYCALVYIQHALDPTPVITEGRLDGAITENRSGQGGFGYDPVFYVPSLEKTVAELSLQTKNEHGHRGMALNHLIEKLRPLL